jgi:hypothetical protein
MATELIEEITGRPIAKVIDIPAGEDFEAYKKAEAILTSEGYTVGTMCAPEPTGFAKGYGYIAKWNNCCSIERELFEGIILPVPTFRDGVQVVYFKTKKA